MKLEQFHEVYLKQRLLKCNTTESVSSGLYDLYDDKTNKLIIMSMPLAHKKSTVVFIMPHHVESLERLEKLLTKEQLDKWMGKMQKTAVAVSLPKVSMEVSHNLQVKDMKNDDTSHSTSTLTLSFI